MSETTVGPNLLQPLEVVAELGVDTVGEDLSVLAVDDVLLPVEEPSGDLVLGRVLLKKDEQDPLASITGESCAFRESTNFIQGKGATHEDGDNPLELFGGELTSTIATLVPILSKISHRGWSARTASRGRHRPS